MPVPFQHRPRHWHRLALSGMLEEILFRPPLYAAAASGLPAIILFVE